MLAKILEDLWVDPDLLEAMSEEQKRLLFMKMREEQVRRWRVREEEEERTGQNCTRVKRTVKSKQVSWLLGRDGDVSVIVIGETDDFRGCKLLQNINNRLQGDNLNGIQTQTERAGSRGGEDFKTHNANASSSSSEEDMDLKDTDSSDSDSSSGSEVTADWAPPLYLPQPAQLQNRTREEVKQDTALSSVQKPVSCRGRVAELRKTFTSENSPHSKPPVPVKPLHLQRQTAACTH